MTAIPGRIPPEPERWAYVPGLVGTPRAASPRIAWALLVAGSLAMAILLIWVLVGL